MIITGNYAKNTQRTDSDLGVVIICDDKEDTKKIYAELIYDCEISIPEIHLYIFRRDEFLSMLIDKKQNYGKEIVRNNIIWRPALYRIISNVVKNGFNG
ncbi:MAG: hypothetical protein QW757_00470 [Candidatus Woesearchaeota archaeon]